MSCSRFSSISKESYVLDAPEGTIAVPLPDSVYAVTEMVGLPRESRTSSALRPVS